EGGQWTVSRALGEARAALEALEARKSRAGKDFGELVRERRRQRGLPLPIADKVLPFRPAPPGEETVAGVHAPRSGSECAADGAGAQHRAHTPQEEEGQSAPGERRRAEAEARMVHAWEQLADAERRGAPVRELRRWEQTYLRAVGRYAAA